MTGSAWPRVRRRDRRLVLHELTIAGGPHAPAAARAAVEGLTGPRLDEGSANAVGPLVAELVAQTLGGGHATPPESVHITITLLPRALRVEVADPAGPAWCEFVRPRRAGRASRA